LRTQCLRTLVELRDAALRTRDEAMRTRIVESSHALISRLEDRGVLTRQKSCGSCNN
jgi:hypothetical protein